MFVETYLREELAERRLPNPVKEEIVAQSMLQAEARAASPKPRVGWLLRRRTLGWFNALGGAAVLASYAHGLWAHPASRGAVWGDVPDALRPVYTVTMLLAAVGYLAFTYFVLFRLDPRRTQVAGRFGYGAFIILYALILIPSALWMPLTFAMLEQPGAALWVAIRAVLALVGLGSVGLLAALLTVHPRSPHVAHRLAVAGAVALVLQTAVLDALVWPAFFPR
jgi:hypothetical protein